MVPPVGAFMESFRPGSLSRWTWCSVMRNLHKFLQRFQFNWLGMLITKTVLQVLEVNSSHLGLEVMKCALCVNHFSVFYFEVDQTRRFLSSCLMIRCSDELKSNVLAGPSSGSCRHQQSSNDASGANRKAHWSTLNYHEIQIFLFVFHGHFFLTNVPRRPQLHV